MEACRYEWPDSELVEAHGNVIYHESMRTWNTLRLARKIVAEFPVLRDVGARVGYRAVLPRSAKRMTQLLEDVHKGILPPPLLLFFFKQDE